MEYCIIIFCNVPDENSVWAALRSMSTSRPKGSGYVGISGTKSNTWQEREEKIGEMRGRDERRERTRREEKKGKGKQRERERERVRVREREREWESEREWEREWDRERDGIYAKKERYHLFNDNDNNKWQRQYLSLSFFAFLQGYKFKFDFTPNYGTNGTYGWLRSWLKSISWSYSNLWKCVNVCVCVCLLWWFSLKSLFWLLP